MAQNVTSHTTMHYTDGESSLRKKTAVEFIMPILMIVVGIVGIYLLLYAS